MFILVCVFVYIWECLSGVGNYLTTIHLIVCLVSTQDVAYTVLHCFLVLLRIGIPALMDHDVILSWFIDLLFEIVNTCVCVCVSRC